MPQYYVIAIIVPIVDRKVGMWYNISMEERMIRGGFGFPIEDERLDARRKKRQRFIKRKGSSEKPRIR